MAVDYDKLRKLVGTAMTNDQLSVFVEAGQLIVDTHLATSGLTTTVLDMIALYLSGHYYVLSVEGGGITASKVGQSEERYHGIASDKVGFFTTRFGQQAVAMDTTGKLVAMSAQTSGTAIFKMV